MKDCDLRVAVKRKLLAKYAKEYPGTLVFEELGLRHGSGRIDLAVVNGTIHGFELKSDLDNLTRLPRQIQIYNSVLDKVTLIVGCRHVDVASELVPYWWGIKLATVGKRGGISFLDLRRARANPLVDPLAVAKLLWRDEALLFLVELGKDAGVRSKPRAIVYERLTQVVELEAIRQRVCLQMRHRSKWLVPVFGGGIGTQNSVV
jgi:hypothetical protein